MTPIGVALVCVFLQVGLTFWAVIRMGMVRVASLKSREVKLGDIALATHAYPDHVKPHQNNVDNQFQTPTLLYVVVGLAAGHDAANWGLAVGAVIFIVSRFVHRAIHVGKNDVTNRFYAYLVGIIGLFIAWASLGLALLDIV